MGKDFEDELAERIVVLSDMFYGLTTEKLASVAFAFAERQKIKHNFNRKKMRAGPDWVRGFLRRHPEISVRKPENHSMARIEAVNKKNLQQFYDNVSDVMKSKGPYPPHRIYNVDETGLAPVVEPPRVLAAKGRRKVGQVSTAERGKLTTVIACVSASGAVIPPMMIFGGRKRFNPALIQDAPLGTIGGVSDNGWVTTALFLEWFAHFVEHAGPSQERRVLLIMDNHASHISLDIVAQARKHGVDIVTLPPHCSHIAQPLDLSVFGPLKTAWARQIKYYHDSHPGQRVTDAEIGGLLSRAWTPVFRNTEGIMNGFKSSGLLPFNPDQVLQNPAIFQQNKVLQHLQTSQDPEVAHRQETGAGGDAGPPPAAAVEAGDPGPPTAAAVRAGDAGPPRQQLWKQETPGPPRPQL